jgi:broad specificity polyphosphatase/5'/3'-nucleotidase SurE
MTMTLLPAAVLGVVYGSLLLVLLLLNRRDRRDALLRATIGACLTRELRGMVAMSVTVAMWRTRARVVLDMQDCAVHQTWQVIERLGPRLPCGTTLSVSVPTPAADCGTSILVVRRTAKPGDYHGHALPLRARGA